MKKNSSIPILLLLSLSLLQLSAVAADGKNILWGEIKGLQKGFLQLILEEDMARKKRSVLSEIPVDENGRFRLEKELAPHIYTLKLTEEKSITLAIEVGQRIEITGTVLGPEPLKITGSEDTKKLEEYETFRKASLNRLVLTVRYQIRELIEKGVSEHDIKVLELTQLEIENYSKHKDELIQFIKKEMGTSIAVYATSIRWDGEKNFPFLMELAEQFEAAHPRTEIAARLSEKVKALTANAIGSKASAINMPDKNGDSVPLASIKAKFILVDFWASWCLPCRRESSLLGELYKKFKPQGFEIYAVGLDASKDAWLKAIERDKRTWINVSTFQEFKTPVTFDYAITSLPSNVLIDQSGRVIAKNLHGDELKKAVEKLFSNPPSPETTNPQE